MPRLRPPLPVIAAIATISGALLLGSPMLVSACPFSGSGGLGNPRNSNVSSELNGLNDTGRPSGSGDSEFSLRQSNGLNHDRGFGLVSNSKRLSITETEIAGLGAVIGLFVLAICYKVRHGHRIAPAEAALLSKYPFLEHPEMALTLVPQEALSSAFETESIAPRYYSGNG